jgi:hypothetical protein
MWDIPKVQAQASLLTQLTNLKPTFYSDFSTAGN